MKQLLFSIFFFISLNLFSQVKIGLNGNVFLPINFLNQNQNYSRAIGLGLSVKYVLEDNYSLGVFGSANINNNNLPGTAGFLTNYGFSFEYIFQKSSLTPYVGTDIGYYNSGISSFVGNIATNFKGFGVAPNIGMLYEFSEKAALDVNLKFHHIFYSPGDVNLGSISVGIVYMLGGHE